MSGGRVGSTGSGSVVAAAGYPLDILPTTAHSKDDEFTAAVLSPPVTSPTTPTIVGTPIVVSFGGSSRAVPVPAGAAAGDMMVVMASHAYNPTGMAGFTQVNNLSGSNYNGSVYTKILAAGDLGTSPVVTFAGNYDGTVGVFVLRTPVGAPAYKTGTFIRLGSGAPSSEVVTTAAAVGDVALVFHSVRGNQTLDSSETDDGVSSTTESSGYVGHRTAVASVSGGNITTTLTATGSGSGEYAAVVCFGNAALPDPVINTKWTKGFKQPAVSIANSWLKMVSQATSYAQFIRQTAPAGDFTIACKASIPAGSSGTDARPGIFVARTADSKALVCGFGLSGGPYKAMWMEHSNYSEAADWGAYNGNWSNNQGGFFGQGAMWYRMRWISASGTIGLDYSADGVTWTNFANRTGWSQPDRIGLVLESNSGNTAVGETMNVDWFRVTE